MDEECINANLLLFSASYSSPVRPLNDSSTSERHIRVCMNVTVLIAEATPSVRLIEKNSFQGFATASGAKSFTSSEVYRQISKLRRWSQGAGFRP